MEGWVEVLRARKGVPLDFTEIDWKFGVEDMLAEIFFFLGRLRLIYGDKLYQIFRVG